MHIWREQKAKCFSGSVPAEPGVQLPSPEGRLGHSTLPVGGSTLPTLHCNLADLLAESSLPLPPPEEQLDLRLNKTQSINDRWSSIVKSPITTWLNLMSMTMFVRGGTTPATLSRIAGTETHYFTLGQLSLQQLYCRGLWKELQLPKTLRNRGIYIHIHVSPCFL